MAGEDGDDTRKRPIDAVDVEDGASLAQGNGRLTFVFLAMSS